MEIISSLENNNVKNWTKLKNKKYREETNLFLVEGEHLVIEAIKAKKAECIILVDDNFETDLKKYFVTFEVMKKISFLETPPNIIAVCKKLEVYELGNKLILVDSLQDPGNLGTIIRTSVAFNIDTVILGTNTVDLYNDKVIRASEGTLFKQNIIEKDLSLLIPELKSKGYKVYGTKVDNGTSLKDIKFSDKTAFIVGNEGSGVDENLLNLCDEFIYIPMNDACESLNVSVASSIIMYEMNKGN